MFKTDANGFYGDFGGAYVPEMLYPNIEELANLYLDLINESTFQENFQQLLRDYVGRPSPLYYARRFSDYYKTKIYFKREDLNHTGAHKINNTVGQALLAQRLGKKRIIAETGAGQHGVATATVCALLDLECVIYMGKVDIERQQPNVQRMQLLGAKIVESVSGSQTLKDATNDAMRDWINNPTDTHYIIGSVVGPHPYPDLVSRFQAVISAELRWQLKAQTGSEEPDYILACVGGGSNAAGSFYHFADSSKTKLIGLEAAGKGIHTTATAATMTLGTEGILHASRSLVMQTADGQVIEPYSISAGLDYPGIGPLHAHLHKTNRAQYFPITDTAAMAAAKQCMQLEGIIPAIETAHALAYLKDLKAKKDEVVVVNLSGRGDKDLETYLDYWG